MHDIEGGSEHSAFLSIKLPQITVFGCCSRRHCVAVLALPENCHWRMGEKRGTSDNAEGEGKEEEKGEVYVKENLSLRKDELIIINHPGKI